MNVRPRTVARSKAKTSSTLLNEQIQAIGDESRLKMLTALGDGCELCACDLMKIAGLSQPLTSHHLRVLREADLVEYRRQGTWLYYRQNTHTVNELVSNLGKKLSGPAKLARVRECAPAE